MNNQDFLWFIQEREAIRLKKVKGLPPPRTEDYILHNTRFCNIDRIHDRGTMRLLNFIEGMTDRDKIFYITLYRSAISSKRFLEQMTGIWEHDYHNLQHLKLKISDARKPYQVFLHSGDSVQNFLVVIAIRVAEFIYSSLVDWDGVSILQTSEEIADKFKVLYNRRLIFLATEIVKDLTYFFPQKILPDSECRMNIGARLALKRLPGSRIDEKVEELIIISDLDHSSIEHGLCEWNRYILRRNYYDEMGNLKPAWIYTSSF